MRVLSLFDGIACARLALGLAQIPVEKYWSSEIDPWASAVARKQYPDMIELGNVCSVKAISFDSPIDLLIGGSPCQDLTHANAGRKGLAGERSRLFFEYVRIRNELKPRWFILENVGSMSEENRDLMTVEMGGIEPITINSRVFVPQSRKRHYWTNIPVCQLSEPAVQLQLCSILETELADDALITYYLSQKHKEGIERNYTWKETRLDRPCGTLMASYYKRPPYGPYIPCESSPSNYRMLTPKECERLQGVPDNYTAKGILYKQQKLSPSVTIRMFEKEVDISDTQRYKMLGNGFTVPVIAWLLSFIPNRINSTEKTK